MLRKLCSRDALSTQARQKAEKDMHKFASVTSADSFQQLQQRGPLLLQRSKPLESAACMSKSSLRRLPDP